jgi:predicted DNA-binding transcriptional regulator AlpA
MTTTEQARRAAQAKHADKMRAAEQRLAQQRAEQRVLLSAEDLWAFGVTFSRVQLWKQVKLGLFPAPIKLSANRNAWIKNEVAAWVEARKAERTTTTA